ncbi:(2Fe-2S)-binding protein [Pleomorphochaeta sp. DL1XJH-081]|jgi:NAD(P)H-nitrite reductase large subunit|uniref:(2Fe-2S)-binding protein n=1 Tax=Pleomorphochaeta sp. DL1XJH-081 TaxID=3409690 RepID=UPI003BB6DFD3
MKEGDKDFFICRCEEVTLKEIEDVIDEGYHTIDDIKRITRAGMGLCQGRSCGKVIARIIAQKTGKPIEEVLQVSYRFPVRTEKMKVLDEEGSTDAQDS